MKFKVEKIEWLSYVTMQGKTGYPKEKDGKKDEWVMCDCDCELKSPPSPVSSSPTTPRRPAPKAVDEDLYKISPHLLRQHAKRVNFFFHIS